MSSIRVSSGRDRVHDGDNGTLLVSPEDKAVAMSRWLHKHDRVGIVPPVHTYPDTETIEVGGFGMLEFGHGYFAEIAPVVQDIREAIETKKTASQPSIPKPFENHFMIDVSK